MILSILAGLLAGAITVYLVEMVGHSIYPPPEGFDFDDPEQLKELMNIMPLGALVFVIVGWATGALLAGFTSTAILIEKRIMGALITGGAFMMFGLAMLIMIPHPTWFAIAGMAVYLPSAYIGGKIAEGLIKKDAPTTEL